MKIFPLRPLSNFDKVANLYKIVVNQTPKNIKELDSDVVSISEKPLKKGRSICDMLSE